MDHQRWRRVLVLTHTGVHIPEPPAATSPPQLFIEVTNISPKREIEIAHVWTEGNGHWIPVSNPLRPLRSRLRFDETYETWVPLSDVPFTENLFRAVKVRRSSANVVRSRQNKTTRVRQHRWWR